MTRQSKLIVLLAYLLILAVVMLGYHLDRSAKIRRLRADLLRITTQKNRTTTDQAEVSRLSRLIPSEVNSPAFIESLYRCALESGLKQHEVATEAAKMPATARPVIADTTSVVKHRIKVSASGSYRSFAEYIRRVQNIGPFSRITDFKLAPDAGQLNGTFTIELYSLPVIHAK